MTENILNRFAHNTHYGNVTDTMSERLTVPYDESPHVRRLIEHLVDCLEAISLSFDNYGDPTFKGPGLYFAVVAGHSVSEYADPMGQNTWPVDECRTVTDDIETFYQVSSEVSRMRDGAVVVGVEGTILEQMVRFRSLLDGQLPDGISSADAQYDDWMGARHMSACEMSLVPDIITTVTLSEETGQVTLFEGGEYVTHYRSELGGPWRVDRE